MADPNVAIGESELHLIGEYVQSHLPGWMEQLGVRAQPDPVTIVDGGRAVQRYQADQPSPVTPQFLLRSTQMYGVLSLSTG